MTLTKVEKKFDRHYESKCVDAVVEALERQYGTVVLLSEKRNGGEWAENLTHRIVVFHSPHTGVYLTFKNQALKGSDIRGLTNDVTSTIYWGVEAIVAVPDTPSGVNVLGTIETALNIHRASPARIWGYEHHLDIFRSQEALDAAYAAHKAKTAPSP